MTTATSEVIRETTETREVAAEVKEGATPQASGFVVTEKNIVLKDSIKDMLLKFAAKLKINITVIGFKAADVTSAEFVSRRHTAEDGLIIYNPLSVLGAFASTYSLELQRRVVANSISDDYIRSIFNCTPVCSIYIDGSDGGYFSQAIDNEVVIIFDLLSSITRVNDFDAKELLTSLFKQYAKLKSDGMLLARAEYNREILQNYMNFVHDLQYKSKKMIRQKLNLAAEEIRGHYRAIQNLEQQMVESNTLAISIARRITKNVNDTNEVCVDKMLAPLFKSKMYKDFIFGPDTITGYTGPITIHHKNHDYLIGNFEVRISLDGNVQITNLTNRVGGEYDHPHVHDKSPCLGNIKEQVQTMIRNFNFLSLFNLLHVYLCSYINHEGYRPFVSISKWQTAEWCEGCDTVKAECQCPRDVCRVCGRLIQSEDAGVRLCICERCPRNNRLMDAVDCSNCSHWSVADEECRF